MPIVLPPSLQWIPVQIRAELEQREEQVDDVLRVRWTTKRVDVENQVIVFEGDVRAFYGPTELSCARLVLNSQKGEGRAEGLVQITDPDGVITAREVVFQWRARTGSALDAEVRVEDAVVRADRVDFTPDKITLTGVKATLCEMRPPSLGLDTGRAIVRPGRTARLDAPTLRLGGRKVVRLPYASFSLDRRATGLRMPAVSYRQRDGLGVNWSSTFALADGLAISGAAAGYRRQLPSYGLQLAASALGGDRFSGFLAPRSELGERYTDGYLDSITVRSPEDELATLGQQRLLFALGTLWNTSTTARRGDAGSISKRWEAVGEAGGAFGPGAGFLQLRLQDERPDRAAPFDRRALALGSARASQSLGRSADLDLRLDGFGSLSGGDRYGWIRLMPSLRVRPMPALSLAAGYERVLEFGTPQYLYDAPYSTAGWRLRSDLQLGSARLSALAKYDFGTRTWYDFEGSLAIGQGCLEPYVAWRKFPSEYRFGVRVRLDTLLERLQRRKIGRTAGRKK